MGAAGAGYGDHVSATSAPPEARRQIDWTTANVADGTLSVELSGGPARGWRGQFDSIRRLLDQGTSRWGRVSMSRSVVTVTRVQPGAEPELRHFLESVVMQVNADLGLGDAPEREGEEAAPRDLQRAADREMAAHFRAFADPGG